MASLQDKEIRDMIAKAIETNAPRIEFNKKLYNLYSGSIKDQLADKILADLGENVYARVKERLSPVNMWKKIVDKLSGIYSTSPLRRVEDGNEKDQELLDKMVKILDFNSKMNKNNELYNSFGYSSLHIARNGDAPFVRSIPNHQFITLSMNHIDPTEVDIQIAYMDTVKNEFGEDVDIFWVYSDYEFIIIDKKGDIQFDLMEQFEQDGSNPVGILPFINLNDNDDETMSPLRLDDLDMTLIVPLLLTDLNYGLKFSIFSIIYTLNANKGEMVIGPDAIWEFHSDPESDKDPTIGTIKPEFASTDVLEAIKSEVALWLDSKGMKPGSIGSLTTDNAASGISKMVDMADVSEEHDQQATIYARKEMEFWEKFFKNFYPFWVKNGLIENHGAFSPNAKVVVEFLPKVPFVDRGNIVEDLDKEIKAGLISVRRAIMKLNPDMDESDVDALMAEIEEEKPEEVISFGKEQNGNEAEATNPIGVNA